MQMIHDTNSPKRLLRLCTILILPFFFNTAVPAKDNKPSLPSNNIATFSIVALDPHTGELGVAVASRFFAVGSVVPCAKAKVGAVATQALANITYGEEGLELLQRGLKPKEVIHILLRRDPGYQDRQVGIVAANGESASYTGEKCIAWAGSRNGPNYAVQGNILKSKKVIIAMEKTFLETKGTLAKRMYNALLAGEQEGGDTRGKQSAAMMIVQENAGYGGTDRKIDIRVDDHPTPFKELGRLLEIAQKLNYKLKK